MDMMAALIVSAVLVGSLGGGFIVRKFYRSKFGGKKSPVG